MLKKKYHCKPKVKQSSFFLTRAVLDCFVVLLLAMTIVAHPAVASPQEELEKTRKEASEAKTKTKKLEEEAKAMARKREAFAKQMVKAAAALQASEARLSAIEDKLRILNEQIDERTTRLAQRKKELASMMQAAVKLGQTPPESIIIMPGDMLDNMKASRALKMTTDSIKTQSDNIRREMAEFEELKVTVGKSQEEAEQERVELDKQRAELKEKIEENNILQQKLDVAQKEARSKAQQLAKKAEDLKEFITALEKEKQQKAKNQQNGEDIDEDTRAPSGQKGNLRSFRAAKGMIRVPAAGKLVQRYGVVLAQKQMEGA